MALPTQFTFLLIIFVKCVTVDFAAPNSAIATGSTTSDAHNIEPFYSSQNSPHLRQSKILYSPISSAKDGDPPFEPCPSACICSGDVVDCSYKNLTTIPKLPLRARYINLRGNMIKNVHCSSFANLYNIERLDLSHNLKLSLSNCALKTVGQLKYLTLSDCALECQSFKSAFFAGVPYLIELNLSHNFLVSECITQETFTHLGHLERLDLSKNILRFVRNDTFVHLGSLRFLSLQYNSLWYRENTFALRAFNGLRSLETLILTGNQERFWPDVIYPDKALSTLPWLQRLSLDGFSDRPLGPGFSALTNLTHLNLNSDIMNMYSAKMSSAYCDMKEILPEDFFANLKTSRPLYLNLSRCQISEITENALSYLPTLYSLDLSHNTGLRYDGLSVVAKALENTTISILDISYCNDEVNTDTYSFLSALKKTKLKILKLDGNFITEFRSLDVNSFPASLETLSLHRNNLDLSHVLFSSNALTNLRVFNISRQSPIYIPNWQQYIGSSCCVSKYILNLQLPKNLEVYDASDSHYTFLPQLNVYGNTVLRRFYFSNDHSKCICGPFQGVPSLEYLDLSRNFCFYLSPQAFEGLSSLKTLLLNDNQLENTFLDDTEGVIFSHLTSLENLNLGNNVIRDLSPNSFIKNYNLRTIDLSHNSLSRFVPSLENATHLQYLDLSHNCLLSLSPDTCQQLKKIKSQNPQLTVYIRENSVTINCDNFQFLVFLVEHAEIFGDLDQFRGQTANGHTLFYDDFERFLPELARECRAFALFTTVFSVFLCMLAGLSLLALYHYKRWQWTYLYYVGKSRLHIGSTLLTYKSVAHVFITFDQDNLECRRLVHTTFLPHLRQMGISHILGEVDFAAGPLAPSIAGAVASTQKTLVLLSVEMFEDYHRTLEVNLAIMHELTIRRPVLVPVILLKGRHGFGRHLEMEYRPFPPFHRQLYIGDEEDGVDLPMDRLGEQDNIREHWADGEDGEDVDQGESLQDLLDDFPSEITAYLIGQKNRCIIYDGGSEEFWDLLTNALLTDE